MITMRVRTVLVAAAAASLLAVGASAAVAPLTVEKVNVQTRPDLMAVRIELNRMWLNKAFAPGTGNTMTVLYDSNRDRKVDYTGRIIYRNGHHSEYIKGHGNQNEPVPLARRSRKAALFEHPTDVIYTGVAHKKQLRVAVVVRSGGTVTRVPVGLRWLPIPQTP